MVRASGCQSQSRYSPEFDSSILRHSEIWEAADEAVLNNVYWKKSPLTSVYPKILRIYARNGSTIRKAGMPTWFLHEAPPPAPIKCPFSYTCQPSHKNTNWTAHSATRSGAEERCKTSSNLPLCFSNRLESSVDWRWPLTFLRTSIVPNS